MGRLQFLGPVFRFDLIRSARQGRFFLFRGLYGLALLLVLFGLYAEFFGVRDLRVLLTLKRSLGPSETERFALVFFQLFFAAQLAVVCLLTPAYTATAIAEEREHRTLDFLLASDLSSGEIVVGKLVARLLTLIVILLVGLPVLSLLQLLGGVDPNLVLAGFAVSFLTTLSLGSLGIFNSSRSSRPRSAVLTTYAQAVVLLALTLFLGYGPLRSRFHPLYWAGACNPILAYQRANPATGTTVATIATAVVDYAIVHGIAALVLSGLAARRLRSATRSSLPQIPRYTFWDLFRFPAGETAPPVAGVPRHFRPRMGDDPILWRELYAEQGQTLPPFAGTLIKVAAGTLLVIATLIYLCGLVVSVATGNTALFANLWVRLVGTPLALLLILAVAVRASTAFSSERDRQTLDSLLTTPLDDQVLLSGKWLGSLLSVRDSAWALILVWIFGMMAGGVHLLSILMLAAAWCVHAGFAACVGLWFSLRSRTSLRATIWTLVTLLGFWTGQPLMWVVGYPLAVTLQAMFGVNPTWARDLSYYSLTPPVTFYSLTYPFGEWYSFHPRTWQEAGEVGLAWVGICLYAVFAVALWGGLRYRFAAITGRMPDRSPHPEKPTVTGCE